MKRVFILLFLLVSVGLPSYLELQAQDDETESPDYRVSIDDDSITVSEDGTEIIIRFTVSNSGGETTETTTAELVDLTDRTTLASVQVPPVGAEEAEQFTLVLDATDYAPDTEFNTWITVGIGDIEAENSRTAFDNRRFLPPIIIPERDDVEEEAEVEPTSTPTETETTSDDTESVTSESEQTAAEGDSSIITIPLIDYDIDTNDEDQIRLLGGIGALVLVMVVIVLLLLRILSQKTPKFGNAQPPYATMPPMDPNSTFGRRQLWQQHAQNNTLPFQSQADSVHARKLLLGMDGYYLSGWTIRALRMTQYDMYGRVARSEVLASSRQLKRLSRVARKSDSLEPEQVNKRVRPVAKGLAKQLKDKLTKKSAMLPVALDVRFTGIHGEVRIVFELYQNQGGMLQPIDQWEPDMTVVTGTINETYTYTIHGQTGSESYRDFKNRLADDIASALSAMMQVFTPGGVPHEVTQQVEANTEKPL